MRRRYFMMIVRTAWRKHTQRSRLLRRIGNHICLVYIHISFGHTFVTRMNQSGMSPFTVRKIVGHAHVNMTEYYTHLEQEYISDEFNKFSEKYEEEKVPAIPEKNNKGKLWKITLIIKKY